jgi:hypothetical protein
MTLDTTNYEVLSQTEWRVSFTEETPDVQIERLFEEFQKELPRYKTPVIPSVIDFSTASGVEKRLLIKHQEPPYDMLHILIGLKNFGNFVYASEVDCLVKEPSPPTQKSPKRPSCLRVLLTLLVLYVIGSVMIGVIGVMSVMFGEGAGAAIGMLVLAFGFFGVVAYLIKKFKDKQGIEKQWDDWRPIWESYWRNIQRIFLDQFDNTLFQLQDSTREIMNMLLQRMYPQAEGVKEEKSTNNRDEIRKRMQADLAKHRGNADAVKQMFGN